MYFLKMVFSYILRQFCGIYGDHNDLKNFNSDIGIAVTLGHKSKELK